METLIMELCKLYMLSRITVTIKTTQRTTINDFIRSMMAGLKSDTDNDPNRLLTFASVTCFEDFLKYCQTPPSPNEVTRYNLNCFEDPEIKKIALCVGRIGSNWDTEPETL